MWKGLAAFGPLGLLLAFLLGKAKLILPLLKFAVEATIGTVSNEPTDALLSLIFSFDAMLTIASLMLFPAIWNP